ncbi:MAG TPA: SRPBCC family protein [Acidimicrobiales bacterium]|nr:SRPBCC family protein [Acidimicrobiales bacterium]
MKPITAQPAAWIGGAPVKIVETIDIGATPEAVWEVIIDHERWPNWFDALESVTRTNDVDGVGGTRQVSMKAMTADEEFLEWEPGRRFGFTVTAMNQRLLESLNERIEIEPLDGDRCRVTYTQGFAPVWWVTPLFAVAKGQIAKSLREGLAGLKVRAES